MKNISELPHDTRNSDINDSDATHIKLAVGMAAGMLGLGLISFVPGLNNEPQPKENPAKVEQDNIANFEKRIRDTAVNDEFKESDQVGLPFIAEQDTALIDIAEDALKAAFGDKAKDTFTANYDTMQTSAESFFPQPKEEYVVVAKELDSKHDGKELIITKTENVKQDSLAVDTIPSPTFEGAPSVEAQDKN